MRQSGAFSGADRFRDDRACLADTPAPRCHARLGDAHAQLTDDVATTKRQRLRFAEPLRGLVPSAERDVAGRDVVVRLGVARLQRQGLACEVDAVLKAAGAVAFSDGAKSVTNTQVMRRALTYARDFDALIVHHTEDPDLVGEGVMNESEFAARLGLMGIPDAAEAVMLERDIRLVGLTGGRYHAASLSCIASLDILKRAGVGNAPIKGDQLNRRKSRPGSRSHRSAA